MISIRPVRRGPIRSLLSLLLVLNSIASKTKITTTTKTKNTAATMPRKAKSIVDHRRKNKSNTTTTTPNNAAKRSKVEESGILQGSTALLRKMDDKDLIAVMAHVVTTLEEKTKQTAILQPPVTVTATAAEGATATATATATVNSTTAANSTTTTPEAANPTTEVNLNSVIDFKIKNPDQSLQNTCVFC